MWFIIANTAGRRAVDVTFLEYQFEARGDAKAAVDGRGDNTPEDRPIEDETAD